MTEKLQIAEYSPTATALAELRMRLKDIVYDLRNSKGLDSAKKDRAEVRGLRTALEAKRKEIKAPALQRCQLIDAEASRITVELGALERPIDEQIKAEERRKEAERSAKAKAEQERLGAIHARISEIKSIPLSAIGSASVKIAEIMDDLIALDFSATDFAELLPAAELARGEAVKALVGLHTKSLTAEAETRRLEEVRTMLAEQKRQQEAAEAERLEKARKEQKEAAKKMAEERAKIKVEQAAARAAQKALDDAAAAERARLAEIEAKAQAKACAELESQRAEFARQQAEARLAEEARKKAAQDETAKVSAETARVAAEAKAEADKIEADAIAAQEEEKKRQEGERRQQEAAELAERQARQAAEDRVRNAATFMLECLRHLSAMNLGPIADAVIDRGIASAVGVPT